MKLLLPCCKRITGLLSWQYSEGWKWEVVGWTDVCMLPKGKNGTGLLLFVLGPKGCKWFMFRQ